jgi:hypothetical protein
MGLITSYQTAEFGKFVEITGNTQYPAVSVVRLSYPDTSNAFPENSGLTPLSSVDVYSKYAVLTKLINPEDIKISLSAENINVNLDEIQLNTDELEGLTKDLNAELSATRIDMNYQFDETQTILLTLTSHSEQIKIDTSSSVTLLNELTSSNVRIAGFSIPPYDEINLDYYGSTNNLSSVIYKNNSTPVLSLSFMYMAYPPTLNDALLTSVKKI